MRLRIPVALSLALAMALAASAGSALGQYSPLTSPISPPPQETQRISLHAGWNWVSFSVDPSSTSPGDVLSSIAGKYDYVLGQSGAYAPPPAPSQLNTLASMEPGVSYMLRMKQGAELVVRGTRLPSSTPILLGTGWNWIGCLPSTSQSLPSALSSIAGKYDYLLGESGTYAPGGLYFLNSLASMEPGKGYLLKANRSATIVFTGQAQGNLSDSPAATIPEPPAQTPRPAR